DFMIEAVPEILELKKKIFREADLNSPKHTILATNTSSLPITEIAKATSRPEKVVGMHFFNPPQLMRLVEVIHGDKTSNETVNLTVELARRLGKEPVICRKDVIGFIANRIMIPPTFVTGWLVSEGVFKPEEIDSAAYYRGGQRMGVFGLMDFVGIDVHYNVSKFFEERESERFKVPPIIEDKVKRGELGVKTGKGFYEYPDKTWRIPSSWSESLADKFNPLINVFISINIAAELVDQEIASIEDIDKAVKLGYNLPFGVLEMADKVGVKEVVKQLEELASRYGHIDKLGKILTPHPLLKRMIETGEKFYK
ncbi:MAG: 3-hydroxyacyl-CoA dehydrogenase NAD-binding domain-containing protein, partial [Candidatus Methanomethylicia archaeon]